MLDLILPAALVILIMMSFMFIVFKTIIKKINENTKKYFLDKLQDYDNIIDEKKEEINKQAKELKDIAEFKDFKARQEEKNEESLSTIESEIKKEKKQDTQNETPKKEIYYNVPTPKYREEAFFKNYKDLKNKFNINPENIIKEFIKNNEDKEQIRKYKELEKYRKIFTNKAIYDCLTISRKQQYEVIESVTNDEIKEIMQFEQIEDNKFDILKYVENLDNLIENLNPIIYIYVANQSINYNNIYKYINTLIYKNMSEGIIIRFRDKVYDYSI